MGDACVRRERPERRLSAVLGDQEGVVTWAQASTAGCLHASLQRRVRSGRWQRLQPGVYLASPTAPGHRQLVRAAVLAVGGLVAASHESALWLAGLGPVPEKVHVVVEDGRHVRRLAGVQVHTMPRLPLLLHPAAEPPRVRLDRAVIDAAHRSRQVRLALDVVYSALQSRLTTPARLAAELAARPRHRHRAALQAVLVDAEAGALSGLERGHLLLSRAHGLPLGQRQRRLVGPAGSRYIDVGVDEPGMTAPLHTELDGRTGHDQVGERLRDMARDNLDEEQGRGHLRYGTHDVFGDPCGVAGQTARALQRRGWRGTPRRCGPHCHLPAAGPRASRPDA